MKATVALLTLLMIPATVSAQAARSQTAGFYINAHLNGSSIKVEDSDDVEKGAGAGLMLGYGVSNKIMIFLGFDGANIDAVDSDDTYGLGHADLGVRYSFANQAKAWIPFLQASLTGRAAVYDNALGADDLTVSGVGVTIGGGIGYHFSRSWALEGALQWTGGKFTQAKLGGTTQDLGADEFSATSARFNLGVSFTPKK